MHFFKCLGNGKDKFLLKGRDIKNYNKIRAVEKRKYLCHAPFKSMSFYHTGDVMVCSFNKMFPIGKYPQENLEDIWFGIKAEQLREKIKKNDLSLGCIYCKNQIKNKNYYFAGALINDNLPEKTGMYPVALDFQMSNTCNFNCIMCTGEYSSGIRIEREKKQLYDNPYDENFYKQIIPFIPHLKESFFSGGETFLAEKFYKIWDLFIKINPNIKISAVTNGSIMNERVMAYLNKLSFNISLSLDSFTEETYKKIRINGDFNAVMKNFDIFHDYTLSKNNNFFVRICPMRQNWQELPDLFTFLNNKNIPFYCYTVFYPSCCTLWNLPSEKLNEIYNFLQKYKFSFKSDIHRMNKRCIMNLINQIKKWKEEAIKREQMNFYSLNIISLKNIFLEKVYSFMKEEMLYDSNEVKLKTEAMNILVTKLIEDSPTDETALRGMQYYASVPIDLWLPEITIRDYEKNYDRFLQISSYNENLYF